MRLARRHLSYLNLTVAFAALLVLGGVSAIAYAKAPPTLTGESFHQGTRPTITSMDCATGHGINYTYKATGRASGPYPGTFTETGTRHSTQHSASVTIHSRVGDVTGTTRGNTGLSCGPVGTVCKGAAACRHAGASWNTGDLNGFSSTDTYRARITTASGIYADHGLFRTPGKGFYSDPQSSLNGFDESFRSALSAPIFVRPNPSPGPVWEGWATNPGSGCSARVQQPYLDSNQQVSAYTEVFCPQATRLTILSRLRSDYAFRDITAAQKGCTNGARCVITEPKGYRFFHLVCPRSNTRRINQTYHTDILLYPGTDKSSATPFPQRSRPSTLSPYCAY